MFDLKAFYREYNEKVKDSYPETLTKIKEICDFTKDFDEAGDKKEYYKFFNYTGAFILKMADFENKVDDQYFQSADFDELWEENKEFYEDVIPENYGESYVDPANCVRIFGDKYGQLMSVFFKYYRNYISYAYMHKVFKMEEFNQLFIDVFEYIRENEINYDELKSIITSIRRKDRLEENILAIKERFGKEFQYFREIVEYSDLKDLRYLFKYGSNITENEIKIAKFMREYPEQKLKTLTKQVAKAYLNGFKRDNKDITKKTTVKVVYNIGQERLAKQLFEDLKELNLIPVVSDTSSTKVNKQYNYDYRFEAALYLDEAYTALVEKNQEDAFEECKDILGTFSGVIHFGNFGEPPFNPENKKENLKFSPEQQKLYQVHQSNIMKTFNKYAPREEWSFTAISFPSPEIGDNFEEVFEDILRVNMLDSELYEGYQKNIIDALDLATYVHVKGKGDNRTDLKVNLQKLNDPDKETNFVNCGADVNIPVGEVFTTPKLAGTNGVYQVEEAYLSGLKFQDLEITFEDGFVKDYNCKNFENDEDNRKYIEENLLFPHKTLPMGEFAIGTNTLAYVISRKHNILDVLPVLIIEKMGPHLAIGDTCFGFEEDKPVFNVIDNKEVTARENEKTKLRKTNIQDAYTSKHIDITIPYESIEFIAAVTGDGERIDIIRDGRFVLAGTEELNKPFE
ncbi:aminopeptidase [bacterium]|nr:aminopeptidase [bacterium]